MGKNYEGHVKIKNFRAVGQESLHAKLFTNLKVSTFEATPQALLSCGVLPGPEKTLIAFQWPA